MGTRRMAARRRGLATAAAWIASAAVALHVLAWYGGPDLAVAAANGWLACAGR